MQSRSPVSIAAFLILMGVSNGAGAAVTISSAATSNMLCSGGVCTPTATKAILNVGDLTTMLAAGDVTVKSNAQAKDIAVTSAFGWASTSRLTLTSARSITIGKVVSVTGPGALTLTTHDFRVNGGLIFAQSGRVTFWDIGSSLVINANAYTLVGNLSGLIAAVTADPAGSYALAKNAKSRAKGFSHSPMDVVFTGKLDGLGNRIDGLFLKPRRGVAGLITEIGANGSVSHLSLTNLSIQANARRSGELLAVGGLTGISLGLIDRVSVSGTLLASNNYEAGFGLLAGENGGTVQNASAAGTISIAGTNNPTGGLVGGVVTSLGAHTISWSHAAVDITNNDYTGGLAGVGEFIDNSYATGNVSGGFSVGGLVGNEQANIINSFATGTVTLTGAGGTGGAGGLVGSMELASTGAIVNCYATGAVTSEGFSGGLIGFKAGTLKQVYSTGSVTATGSTGGLIGHDQSGTTSDAVWDMDTSGITNPGQGAGNVAFDPGVTGLSDTALKSGLPSGFDSAVWGQSSSVNNGYPYLLANPPQQ